ncbi:MULTISPECIES: hypothetical protein [unclassified Streptomyces]|uniref:hypothetical protein n=1 Tax=unclassified Streptomyces TaxID=2593676 RepID=UPI001661A378|nr:MULTISPECIES: hypothetical protein [unclassified Streptomyces]MBD0844106.1 hypothetical protein [Streptomyces sp. TRM68416]
MCDSLLSPLHRIPLPLPDCDRCGFTARTASRPQVAHLVREYAVQWQHLLTHPAPARAPRRTGTPGWSPLEHGCHARDMCLLFHSRLDAILGIAPTSTPSASDLPYRDEDPHRVSRELAGAAESLARRLAACTAEDWDRADPGLADPRLTVGFFTRHLLHDLAHGLAEAGGGPAHEELSWSN